MMKSTWYPVFAVILIVVVWLSGCQGFFPGFSTTYVSEPTKIQYDISYGYQVNSSGKGKYDITYLCGVPWVILGSATYEPLFPRNDTSLQRENNTFIVWNISRDDQTVIELGLSAHVTAENVLIADLNGNSAETLPKIWKNYPTIIQKYTHAQANKNKTTTFIDPANPQISAIAGEVLTTTKTNNSFLLAKAVFSWLKTNTHYQLHPGFEGTQPAAVTLEKKGGDCDDLSFLYISLCRSLGIPARFVRGYLLTPLDNGIVQATAHAWAEVFVGGVLGDKGWAPVEVSSLANSIDTDIQQNFGVEDAFHLRLFVDDGSDDSLVLSFIGIASVSHGISRHIQFSTFATVSNYQDLRSQKLVVNSDNTRHYE
jgi:transglutaminase-like putative cysteine protease